MVRDIEDVEGLSADARHLYDWMIAAFTGDVNEALDIAKSHAASISRWPRERLREAHAELKERGVLEAAAPNLKKGGPSGRHHAKKKKALCRKVVPLTPFRFPRHKAVTVLVYSRPSGYWYAQAHDVMTGAQIADASGYSRENVLRELLGKFAMIGVTIKSITDEDPYVARHHATKKKSPAQLNREIVAHLHRHGLPNGRAKGRLPSEFDPIQLHRGIQVEMEHTRDPKIAERIAMDHLVEDPRYYVKLAKIHVD